MRNDKKTRKRNDKAIKGKSEEYREEIKRICEEDAEREERMEKNKTTRKAIRTFPADGSDSLAH